MVLPKMEHFKAQGRGDADEDFSTIHTDQGRDTIRKLSLQTDNLLAVICLLQNQFDAVKRDMKGIKENVAKLGPRDNVRESRTSKKQVLPHGLRPEPCTSLTDPADPPLTEKDPELRAVWSFGRLEPMQGKSQVYGQVKELVGGSSDQVEGTSDLGTEASPSIRQKWKESQNGRKTQTSSESKNMMQLDITPEPATVHSNSASSECKTENVFDELVNLKNEFQEWRVASSLVPAQLRLEMRHIASAQKEQEHKIDELRKFLNLQTHTFIDQQKLLFDEIKSLSQKQSLFSDELNGMEEKIRANQGWNDYEELLDGMYQQNEDICEVMTHVGKQIKELKIRVKEQSPWSWRCDTCMATSPLKEGSSQKFTSTSAGSVILGPPVSVGGRSGEDEQYDPHDATSTSLFESLDLTTGDEGEEVIFKARGKLFRYDSSIKAWQEGCVGEVKILKNLEIGRARLLMKIEKIHKICANHWLKPDMQLLPKSCLSDCAWVWNAIDFAKGEKFHEKFSLEFKTSDLAAEFKKTFDDMKQWKEKSFGRAEPVKAREAVLLKDKTSGHSVNSKNSYGLRKKVGCVAEKDDLDDIVDDSDDDSDENQPLRKEKSRLADSAFEIPAAKPSSCLIKSPTPAPQSLATHLASTKPTVTTESTFAGFSLNKTPGISLSFASSHTSQIKKSTAPVTTIESSASSCFAGGFSLQTTPSKKNTPSMFGSITSSTQLASTKPTVITQSPPPSQSLGLCVAPSQSTETTQSQFAGFSLNKTPGSSTSFASSQTVYIVQSVAPTTTSVSSCLASGFSFQTTPSKKDTPTLFGSSTSSQQSKDSSAASHMTFSKPTMTTQSPLAGPSFNKTPGMSSSFASSQTFQIPKSTAPVTTSSASSPFAGFSLQTTPSKKDTPAFFGSNASSHSSKDNSAAQQYPQLTALPGGGPNKEEEGTAESPRLGFSAPSQSFETSQRKPGQNPMGVTSSASQKKEDKPSPTPLKGKDDNYDNDDVILMGEVKATPEQVAKAEKLMLPPNFYLYEQHPPCPGCRGCDKEDLKAKKEGNKPIVVAQKSLSFFPEKPKVSEQSSQPPSFFGNAGISSLNFASLTADGNASFAKKDTSTKPFQFAGAGAPVFRSTQQGDDNVAEDQKYGPHYDPIISLPEKVDLTTGDEGQKVVFKERAKLYRYDSDTKAWKEHGVGDMKILVNPQTGKARILMRREQVLKVCANHWLKPDMQLLPMTSSDCAFVWNAIDFADGEECHQQFALKFKTPELAAEFKKTFDEMKGGVKPSLTKPVELVKEKPAEPVEEVKPASSMGEDDLGHKFHQAGPVVAHPEKDQEEEDDYDKYEGEEDGYEDEEEKHDEGPSLSEMFKPALGSWVCDICMINNPADKVQCVACSTTKSGTSQPLQGTRDNKPGGAFSLGNFKFSGFSSNPSAFSAGSGFESSGFNKSTPGTFSFGQTPSQSSSKTPSSSAGFTLPPGGFSFTQPKPETSQPSEFCGFKMPTASSFSFTAPTSPSSGSTKLAANSTTKDQPLSKPTDAAPGQQTITTPNFGSGMPQFTFGGTGQQKPSSGCSFGSTPGSSTLTPQATGATSSSTTAQPGYVLGGKQATSIFGATPEKGSTSTFNGFNFGTKQSEPKTKQKEAISFSDLVKNQGEFSFRLNVENIASSPPKPGAKSPVKSPGLNKSGEYYQEEERNDIFFEPVVTLPENYKLETGEEKEEVKFSQRANLYRFDVESSQWKERGVGDIKVLYNPETVKHRIVMRREQVLTVCANHYITQHVNLQPNKGSERSWVWRAMDSSDGDPQNEQLAVRFKTEDEAREFKEVVDEAKKNLPVTSHQPVELVGKAETKKKIKETGNHPDQLMKR